MLIYCVSQLFSLDLPLYFKLFSFYDFAAGI